MDLRDVLCTARINPLNPELNPICNLLALLAHHFLHVSRIRVKRSLINPLNAELNPICHLLALLGAHHIFHVSEMRVNLISFTGILSSLTILRKAPLLTNL